MENNELVNQGMTQVFTGLGILLGSGRISNATHEQIMGLIQADQTRAATDNTPMAPETTIGRPGLGKETPVSMESEDLLQLDAELDLELSSIPIGGKHSRGSTKPTETEPKVVCPWWSTPGYECRTVEKGRCPFHHEHVPGGLVQPLICHFWANGGHCTKADDDCKFAHYLAQHRIVAPAPLKKKPKTSAGLDYSEHFAVPRPAVISQGSEFGKWHSRPRPPPEDW
ncbi:hypothetical protein F4774DRAFT_386763 [Daldinia eschscholtzii]|nr:hypothetical protein F4774DRAFT_386763 [Daldinia eschscholtzii]